jgi:hypothetical protein
MEVSAQQQVLRDSIKKWREIHFPRKPKSQTSYNLKKENDVKHSCEVHRFFADKWLPLPVS